MRNHRHVTFIVWSLFFLCNSFISAQAAVPSTMSYQGRLVGTNSEPVTNGIYCLKFGLYFTQSGGPFFWSETNCIPVTNGLFSTQLGSIVPLPNAAFFQGSTWLEISVNGITMTPRTQIGSSGYAFRAFVADSVATGAINSQALANNSVTSLSIAGGAVNYNHLAGSTVTQLVNQARAFDSVISVKDYGAVGDGVADDTAAFTNAISAAQRAPLGTRVAVPAGNYLITKTLTLAPSILLAGLPNGGWASDSTPLPWLKVRGDFTNGPVIICKSSSSVHGLAFDMPQPHESAYVAGPILLISGNGVSLSNLRLQNPYQGIMSDSTVDSGRVQMENIFIIAPRSIGVYLTRQFDVATLRNIHIWCAGLNYCLNNTTAFVLARNDEVRLDHCSVVGAKTGYQFVYESYSGGTSGNSWAGLNDCMCDSSQFGIHVINAKTLRVTGGLYWNHWKCINVEGPGDVVVNGADLQSNGGNNVIVNGGSSFTMSGCTLRKSAPDWPTIYKARLSGGRSAVITGCTFDGNSNGIIIEQGMTNLVVTGNLFQSSTNVAINNLAGTGINKIVANNAQ